MFLLAMSPRNLRDQAHRWLRNHRNGQELTRTVRLARFQVRAYGRLVPTFTKILAATDFSDDSNYALGFAEELAHKFGAELTILHVDQPLAPVMVSELSPGLDFGAMSRIAEEQRMMALAELEKTSARLRETGLKSRGVLKVGAPFLEIIHSAQADNFDLIVLGTHGHTGLAHVLMGSVAERVVRKAPCPVLTVRHPDRKFKHPLDRPEKSDKPERADKAEKIEKTEKTEKA
jgi:nucleotide-binding universal stress UspA family protein